MVTLIVFFKLLTNYDLPNITYHVFLNYQSTHSIVWLIYSIMLTNYELPTVNPRQAKCAPGFHGTATAKNCLRHLVPWNFRCGTNGEDVDLMRLAPGNLLQFAIGKWFNGILW
jgi:hypothetical protein